MAGIGSFGLNDIVLYLGIVDAGFAKGLTTAQRQSDDLAKNINNVMNKAILAGGAAFATATIAAANFQKEMSLVDTLLGGANRTVQELSKEVLAYAQTSSQSIGTITKALYDTISASVPASEAMNVVALSAKAAGAGFTSVEIAGRAGIATMNAYGYSTSELTRIFDLQFSSVKYGVLTYEQLASSIGTVLPASAALGASLEDVYGSMAFLTKMGQSADMAATNLSRAFQGLVEQQDKLAQFDITIWDKQTGKFLGMDAVVVQLAKTMEGMTDQQRMATLEAMNFDIRAGRAINTMVLNYENYSKTLKDVANSHGILDDAYERMTNNIDRQAKIFKNIVQVAFIEMGQQLIPVLTSVLKLLNEHPETIKIVVKSFSEFAMVIGTVAAGFKIYQLGAKLVNQANLLMATSFGPIGIAFAALIGAVTIYTNVIEANKKAQIKAIEATSDEVAKVEALEKAYDQLATSEDPKAKDEMRAIVEKLALAYGMTKDEVDKLITKENTLTGIYKERRLDELKKEFESLILVEKTYGQQSLDTADQLARAGTAADAAGWNFSVLAVNLSENEKKLLGVDGATKELNPRLAALQSEISQLESELSTSNLTTEEAAKKSENLATATNKLKSSQEALKKAGIITTKSIEDQIAELNKLYPLVDGNAVSTMQWRQQMNDLNDSLEGLKIKATLQTPAEEAGKQLKDLGLVTSEVRGNFDSFVPKLVETATETEKSTKKFDFATKSVGEYGLQLIDAAGQMGLFGDSNSKASKAAGLFAGTLETVLRGGFDPLSLGISVVTGLFGIFGGKAKEVNRTMEEVTAIVAKAGIDIEGLNKTIEGLEFDSPLLDQMKSQMDSIMEVMRTAVGSTFKNLQYELKLLTDQMEELLQPLELKFEIDIALENVKKLIDGINATSKYLDTSDMTAYNKLLEGQLSYLANLIKTVPEGSQAYKDLSAAINEIIKTLNALNGVQGTTNDGMQQIINRLQSEYNANELLRQSLQDQLDAEWLLQDAGQDRSQQIAELTKMLEDLYWDQKKLSDQINDYNNVLKNNKDAIEKVDLSYKNLVRDALPATQKYVKEVSDGVDKLNLSWKNQNEEAAKTKKIYDEVEPTFKKVTGTIRDQDNAIGRMKESLYRTREELAKSQKELANYKTILEGLYNQKNEIRVKFYTEKADIEKQLADWQATFDSLTAEKKAINLEFDLKIGKTAGDIGLLQQALEDIDRGDLGVDSLYELSKLMEQLSGQAQVLTIDWEDMLDVMFADYDNMTKDLKTAGDALDKMEFFNIDFAGTNVDEQISLAIFRMNDFIGTLDKSSPAFKQAKTNMDNLIVRFLQLSGKALPDIVKQFIAYQKELEDTRSKLDLLAKEKIQIDIDIKNFTEQRDKLITTIDGLKKKRIEIDIKLAEDIEKINEEIKKTLASIGELENKRSSIEKEMGVATQQLDYLNTAYLALASDDPMIRASVNMNDFAQAVAYARGEVDNLGLSWDAVSSKMFSDFDQFFKYDKSVGWVLGDQITDVIDKIKFFKIDFDTSDIDEDLNVLLFRMQDFIATLDPESEAFKEATRMFENLKSQFIALGGVVDENAAIDIVAGDSESTIADLQTLIAGLGTQKTQVDLDIANALAKIVELNNEIIQLGLDAEAEKIQLDLDIIQFEADLLEVTNKLTELELRKPQIDLDISAAQARITELEQLLLDFDLTQFLDKEAAMQLQTELVNTEVARLELLLKELIGDKGEYNLKVDADILAASNKIMELYNQLAMLESDYNDMSLQLDVNITDALNRIDELQNAINGLTGKTIVVGVQDTMHEGGQVLHTGGFVGGFLAHSGGDIPAILKRGEYVIKDNTVAKFDRSQWDNLNLTGNPAALIKDTKSGQGAIAVNNRFDVIIRSADPHATAQFIRNEVTPGVNRINRKMVVKENPYDI